MMKKRERYVKRGDENTNSLHLHLLHFGFEFDSACSFVISQVGWKIHRIEECESLIPRILGINFISARKSGAGAGGK